MKFSNPIHLIKKIPKKLSFFFYLFGVFLFLFQKHFVKQKHEILEKSFLPNYSKKTVSEFAETDNQIFYQYFKPRNETEKSYNKIKEFLLEQEHSFFEGKGFIYSAFSFLKQESIVIAVKQTDYLSVSFLFSFLKNINKIKFLSKNVLFLFYQENVSDFFKESDQVSLLIDLSIEEGDEDQISFDIINETGTQPDSDLILLFILLCHERKINVIGKTFSFLEGILHSIRSCFGNKRFNGSRLTSCIGVSFVFDCKDKEKGNIPYVFFSLIEEILRNLNNLEEPLHRGSTSYFLFSEGKVVFISTNIFILLVFFVSFLFLSLSFLSKKKKEIFFSENVFHVLNEEKMFFLCFIERVLFSLFFILMFKLSLILRIKDSFCFFVLTNRFYTRKCSFKRVFGFSILILLCFIFNYGLSFLLSLFLYPLVFFQQCDLLNSILVSCFLFVQDDRIDLIPFFILISL